MPWLALYSSCSSKKICYYISIIIESLESRTKTEVMETQMDIKKTEPGFYILLYNKYRIPYMLIATIFTSTVLLYYSYLLKPIVPKSNLIREYGICFGQILFQGSILFLIKTKKSLLLDYLSNMMTVSLLGGLLLLPSFILAHYFIIHPMVYLSYFFSVVIFMFFNHQKRVKNIQAPVWLSYTWVLYRCFVLLIIL